METGTLTSAAFGHKGLTVASILGPPGDALAQAADYPRFGEARAGCVLS